MDVIHKDSEQLPLVYWNEDTTIQIPEDIYTIIQNELSPCLLNWRYDHSNNLKI